MEKFISYEKLSKKKQRELNQAKRGSWYGLNPVTRKPENSKAYNRRRAREWGDDSMTVPFAAPHPWADPIWLQALLFPFGVDSLRTGPS